MEDMCKPQQIKRLQNHQNVRDSPNFKLVYINPGLDQS